jgi:hypothetical protein
MPTHSGRVSLPESSFSGMVIHGRNGQNYILQIECVPRKGAINLSHEAAASMVRVMPPKCSTSHDLLQAAEDYSHRLLPEEGSHCAKGR